MKHRMMPWRGLIFIAVCFLAVFAVGMYGVLTSRSAMEEQYAQQQERIVAMEQEVAALENELARVGTDGYVENEARGRYDYVREGELRFEFSDPDKLDHYTEEEWQIIMDEGLYTTY